MDGGGEISVGDWISYSDDQDVQQTVTIDQALADKLTALDQGNSTPNELQLSDKVRSYLEDDGQSTRFNPRVIDNDGDGNISVGDLILSSDDQLKLPIKHLVLRN